MADGGSGVWQYNRVFLMGEIGTDENFGDRPREHCIRILDVVRLVHGYFIFVFLIINMLS